MVVKKIQSEDMQQALASIAKEYGSDAVILESRKVRKKGMAGMFSKPVYEVTVAYDPAKTPYAKRISALKEKLAEPEPPAAAVQRAPAAAPKQSSVVTQQEGTYSADDGGVVYQPSGAYRAQSARSAEPASRAEESYRSPRSAEPRQSGYAPSRDGYASPRDGYRYSAADASRADSYKSSYDGYSSARAESPAFAAPAQDPVAGLGVRVDSYGNPIETYAEPVRDAGYASAGRDSFEPFVPPVAAVRDTYRGRDVSAAAPRQDAPRAESYQAPQDRGDDRFSELESKITLLNSSLDSFIQKLGGAAPAAQPAAAPAAAAPAYPAQVQGVIDLMTAHQVEREVAEALAAQAMELMEGDDPKRPDTIEAAMRRVMGDCIGNPRGIRVGSKKQKVVLFVGATGVGKTTTLVKIAALFSKVAGRKVGIINTDTYRAAALKQLEVYAELMQLPLSVVYEPEEMDMALEALSDCELVLIDTAGKRQDESQAQFISEIVKYSGASEILLAVSATTSYSVLKTIIDSNSFLKDYKLLITKLDEAGEYGNILNISYYSGKPLTYLSTGQNVPDDLAPAKKQLIISRILGEDESDDE